MRPKPPSSREGGLSKAGCDESSVAQIEAPALKNGSRRRVREALLGYSLLCLLSLGSRIYAPLWLAVIIFGFTFPLAWSRLTRVEPPKRGKVAGRLSSLWWGASMGIVFSLHCALSPGALESCPPPLLHLQLIAGALSFAAVLSPSQEIFFRAWLQPRLEEAVGPVGAATATSLLFTIWHYLPPFTGSVRIDLNSASGFISTFVLGLACGLAYMKTRRLTAPWLTHTIAGITITALGGITFVQLGD